MHQNYTRPMTLSGGCAVRPAPSVHYRTAPSGPTRALIAVPRPWRLGQAERSLGPSGSQGVSPAMIFKYGRHNHSRSVVQAGPRLAPHCRMGKRGQ